MNIDDFYDLWNQRYYGTDTENIIKTISNFKIHVKFIRFFIIERSSEIAADFVREPHKIV